MPNFAVYLHPHTCHTSQPADRIRFVGHSYPHFSRVRQELDKVLGEYPPLPVRQADFDEYRSVHADEYLDKITRMAAGETLDDPPRLSIECTGFEHCLPGYCYSLGGMLEAIDRMKAGSIDAAYVFSLGGHHAYANRGHGYCLLNPQAAAARYAQRQGFAKILIIDWDIHHGDGTQAIFAHDPTVHCLSIHSAADLYMALACGLRFGTTTMGEELGHTNIPLLDAVYDDDFAEQMQLSGRFYRAHESLAAFESALRRIPWTPDLILIFSGYDSHADDCGTDITNWTNQDFQTLTRCVLDRAREAGCPVLSVHGGGYKLPVTVPAAASHVEVLAAYRR